VNSRSLPAAYHSTWLGKRLSQRLAHYFDRHPELSREQFLLDALQREVTVREQRDRWYGFRYAHATDRKTSTRSAYGQELTNLDSRIHDLLSERLSKLRRRPRGLWPRIQRLLGVSRFAS